MCVCVDRAFCIIYLTLKLYIVVLLSMAALSVFFVVVVVVVFLAPYGYIGQPVLSLFLYFIINSSENVDARVQIKLLLLFLSLSPYVA